ncbi:uncharacterized protein PFL1_05963 [Pseudozyma flocculosa PF-1]|uniref:Uncharacterized protein n=2 Tax=Pseudozyma flocculosa TaxID=84751 RepID=A0A5C3F552_9BASI|nr:uncharacterized protein PFL1_05963 [Pseudozyma flocculosa PF-1]EPQ26642.1 hypothetical protein PFL1_05963 [Pseudozyma flocculosa PF-1]SPO38361.1 uncharacterized protein PSFLO_03838 [Pseudozyma flocculosa]
MVMGSRLLYKALAVMCLLVFFAATIVRAAPPSPTGEEGEAVWRQFGHLLHDSDDEDSLHPGAADQQALNDYYRQFEQALGGGQPGSSSSTSSNHHAPHNYHGSAVGHHWSEMQHEAAPWSDTDPAAAFADEFVQLDPGARAISRTAAETEQLAESRATSALWATPNAEAEFDYLSGRSPVANSAQRENVLRFIKDKFREARDGRFRNAADIDQVHFLPSESTRLPHTKYISFTRRAWRGLPSASDVPVVWNKLSTAQERAFKLGTYDFRMRAPLSDVRVEGDRLLTVVFARPVVKMNEVSSPVFVGELIVPDRLVT